MVVNAWTIRPAEEPRRLSKQSLGKSIAQKCGRVLGLRAQSRNPQISLSIHDITDEPVHMLSESALAEHEFEFRSCKVSRSGSADSRCTRSTNITMSPDSRSPSKASLASLPGSVDDSDDEDESVCNDPCQQQAELKRIAKQIGQKADFTYRTIRNAFVAVDADGDGRLSASEVAAFCTLLGISSSVASRFYTLMDKDERGNANWQKFMAVFAPVFKEVSAEPPCYATSRLCLPRGQRW